MNARKNRQMRDETIAIHAGYRRDQTTKAVALPIYQTAAYEFDSSQHCEDIYSMKVEGHLYTRLSNPTSRVLERRVAKLEGASVAQAVSSGSAAVNETILTIAQQGNNIVSVPFLYGAAYSLFAHVLPRQGIEGRFAIDGRPSSLEALIDDKTVAIYCESIGNPGGDMVDIEAIANMAHKHGVPLIVDNTVATPILIKPIQYGADIVVHSLTKYMCGHGTSLGGIIVDSANFPWEKYPERFPLFNAPDPACSNFIFTRRFKQFAFIARLHLIRLRNTGACISPFNAFLILQGIETLPLRMERHCKNAGIIANYLNEHEAVSWVSYPGLPNSPYYELAQKYTNGKPSSLMSFGIKGGREACKKFYDALQIFRRILNIGDAKSLACHPASTTHAYLSEEELKKAGIRPEMIRLSVGIEHHEDLITDLDQALAAAKVST